MPILAAEGRGETLNRRVQPLSAGAREGGRTPRTATRDVRWFDAELP